MDKMLQNFRDNWILFSLVGGIIIWYSGVNARLTQAEQELKDLKTLTQEISILQTDIAVIKTNVEFIKETIKRK